MKVIFLSFFILVSLTDIFASSQINDSDYECIQYENIIKKIKSSKGYKKYFNVSGLRLNVYDSVFIGGLDSYLLADFYAYKLGISKADFFLLPKDSIGNYYRQAEQRNSLNKIEKKECLTKRNDFNPNVKLRFTRIDTETIQVGLERIFNKPRHSFGLILIVIFGKDNQIVNIIQTTWIE